MEQKKKTKIKKVIQIIYNILSAVFIGFVCFGLCLSSCSNKDEQAPRTTSYIYETKTKRDYGYQDEYGIQLTLNQADITSNYFLVNFINGLKDNYDSNIAPSIESDYVITFDNLSATSLYNFNYTTRVYSLLATITKIVVSKEYNNTGSEYDDICLDYVINFYHDSTFLTATRYHCLYPQLSQNNDSDIGFNVIYTNSSYYPDLSSTGYIIFENSNNGFCPFIEYFHKPIGNYGVVKYNEGYSAGYSIGYARGETAGYQETRDFMIDYYETEKIPIERAEADALGYDRGYNVGYSAGLSQQGGSMANPFTLIGSAFTSMASILSIELFPNFSLGLLIFIPVILSIVFVVVKAIKG